MVVGDAGSGGSEGEWAVALRDLTQIAQITQMSCTSWISQIFPITIGHQGCFGIEKNLRDRGYNIICEIWAHPIMSVEMYATGDSVVAGLVPATSRRCCGRVSICEISVSASAFFSSRRFR